MKILAIVVSYNFMPWIERCLGSLRKQTVPVDIMVVDNHSSDSTVQTIRTCFPEVMLIANEDNLGFGRANNVGMLKACREGYDGVLLLNQDAWIAPDVVETLAEESRRHAGYGVLSPVHLTASGKKVEHGFASYTGLSALEKLPRESVVTVPFVDAAIWYMPVAALRQVGLFSPIFHLYGEDKDLSNRLAYYGWQTGVVPRIFGCHDREFRQPTRQAFFRAERTYHLSEYCNINYSFLRAFCMAVPAVMKKAFMALLKGHAGTACIFLSMSFGLLLKTPAVVRTRAASKHVVLDHYA